MKPYTPFIPLDEPPAPAAAPITEVSIPVEPDILKAVKHTFFSGELDGSWYRIHLTTPDAHAQQKTRSAFEPADFAGLPW